MDLDELDLTSAESKATYQEIKDYVLKEYGFKVSTLYISQVKRKCGNYIYQDVNIGRAGVKFNISGETQANSVPLSNSKRTFGIALNIYYQGESEPEMHYKEFNAYTSHKQSVSCVVSPDCLIKVVDHVAFAFVYGYNENSMTISNAITWFC